MTPDKTIGSPAGAGKIGLYLFAFSLWLSTAGAYIGLGIMVLAALIERDARTVLRRDPMVKLALLFAGYLLLHALWAVWTTSETYAVLWYDSWKWLRLLLFFIFVAWWLGGDERRIGIALLLAVSGLLIKMLLSIKLSGLDVLLSGQRSGFGLPIISFGLYSATALLGLFVLAPRVWGTASELRYGPAICFTAWGLAIAMLLQGLISSQSRDAWIASLIVFPVILILRLAGAVRNLGRMSWLRVGAVLILGTLLIGAVTTHNLDTIKHRAQDEQASWQALIAGDLDKIPAGSIGYRIRLSEYGLKKWLEHPLIGWGSHSYQLLIAQNDDAYLRKMPHLHNAYIETLLTLGIVGALFYTCVIAFLCTTIYQSCRTHRMSIDYALFLSGALALLLIWCLASFGPTQVTWNFHFAMLLGSIYSYRIKKPHGPMETRVSSAGPT